VRSTRKQETNICPEFARAGIVLLTRVLAALTRVPPEANLGWYEVGQREGR